MAEEVERIYIIPLKKKPGYKSSNAASTAIKRVKSFLTRHMKVEDEKIWIDDSLNNAIWAKGKYHIPSKLRVKAVKFDDGVVEAYLPELEFKKSRREILKEEKEKKEPILIKGEELEEEPGEAPGAEEYEVSPAAEGEVKIKKKKPAKKKAAKKKKPVEKEEKKIKKAKKKPKITKAKKKPSKTKAKATTSKKTEKKSG